MGSLGDYEGGDDKYLRPGSHTVHCFKRGQVKQSHQGSQNWFIRLYFEDEQGLVKPARFWLTKPAMCFVKRLASVQGWDVQTIPDPMEDIHNFPWDIFVNEYEFGIELVLDGEGPYTEIVDMWKVDADAPKRPWPDTLPAPVPAAPSPQESGMPEVDISDELPPDGAPPTDANDLPF